MASVMAWILLANFQAILAWIASVSIPDVYLDDSAILSVSLLPSEKKKFWIDVISFSSALSNQSSS
jgi:hypothetical protein